VLVQSDNVLASVCSCLFYFDLLILSLSLSLFYNHCMKRLSSFFVLFVVFVLPLVFPSASFAYYTNIPAFLVLGQPDFTSGTADNGGISATSMNQPLGACSDGNKLVVSAANRVLIWNTFPTKNQQAADLVLGQADFTTQTANLGGISAQSLSTPIGCWTDGTKLVVTENGNRRVLIWNTFPTRNQQPADVVVGQPDFVTNTEWLSSLSASKFYSAPNSSIIYNGKLIVSDVNANRVLIWNTVPTTNGASADTVIGQIDFTTNPGGTTASKLSSPRSLGVYNGKLFIGDTTNNRFLIFNSIPTTNGASADVVIGQPDFTTSTSFNGGVSCASISNPQGSYISVTNGRLFLPDGRRILVFNSIPTTNFQTADMVIGQPNCTTNGTGTTANTFGSQVRMGPEVNGKLIVGDQGNSRVLIFSNQLPDTKLTNTIVPGANGLERFQGTATTNVTNGVVKQVEFSVNGGPFIGAQPTKSDGLFNSATEPYQFDFDPKWNNPDLTNNVGFTVRVRNTHSNTIDVSPSAFYFEPFNATTPQGIPNPLPTFSFSVNTWRFADLSANLDHFRISVNKNNTGWNPYIDFIPVDYEKVRTSGDNLRASVVVTSGNGTYEDKFKIVTYTNNNGTIAVTPKAVDSLGTPSDKQFEDGGKKLSVGNIYQWKAEAIDRVGHIQETLPPVAPASVGNQQITTSRSFFPLTINQISGIPQSLDLSTIHSGDILSSYTTSSFSPTIGGIAFGGATVTITKTDPSCTIASCTMTYQTTTGDNSRYSFTFPDNSFRYGVPYTIKVSVKDTGGNYNALPSFTLQVGSSVAPRVQGVATSAGEKREIPPLSPTPIPSLTPTPMPTSTSIPSPPSRWCVLGWCW